MDADEHGSKELAQSTLTLLLTSLNGNGRLRLMRLETTAANLPCAGDLRLGVEVTFDGFAGSYNRVWVDVRRWRAFLATLTTLEQTRAGQATIQAMSPEEFELNVRSAHPAAPLIVAGFLGRYHWPLTGSRIQSRVAFAIVIDPSYFHDLVSHFAAFDSADPRPPA